MHLNVEIIITEMLKSVSVSNIWFAATLTFLWVNAHAKDIVMHMSKVEYKCNFSLKLVTRSPLTFIVPKRAGGCTAVTVTSFP